MWVIKHKKNHSILGNHIEDPSDRLSKLEAINVPYLFANEKKAKSFLKTRHRLRRLNKKDYEIIYQGGK